jgi:hypothetical protein
MRFGILALSLMRWWHPSCDGRWFAWPARHQRPVLKTAGSGLRSSTSRFVPHPDQRLTRFPKPPSHARQRQSDRVDLGSIATAGTDSQRIRTQHGLGASDGGDSGTAFS